MELNVIELYKLLTEEPEGFKIVLKNIFGYEILRLHARLEEARHFISTEDGKNLSRNEFIRKELTELAEEFERTMLFASYFRYVAILETDGMTLTPDTIRKQLKDLVRQIKESEERFHTGTRVSGNARTQNMDAFLREKKSILTMFLGVDSVLETLDENLQK